MKKIIRSFVFRAIVSLGLIIILLYIMREKYGQIIAALQSARVGLVAMGFLMFILAISLASVRLKLIIDAQKSAGVTFLEALSLTFIGYFFNNFLPTAIGGDVVKAYYLSKKTRDKAGSYTSVFVDRAIGLFTMIFMAFIALLFVDSRIIDRKVKIIIYAVTAISVVAILFLMNKAFAKKFSFLLFFLRPIEHKMKNIYNAINRYRHHPELILQSFGISVVSQLFFFASIGVLAMSIGSRIPALDILLKMPIVSLMSLLPSVNGLGVREGSTVLLFGPLIGKENAFAISILWLVMLFVISIAGGAVYGLSPQFRVKLKEIEEMEE